MALQASFGDMRGKTRAYPDRRYAITAQNPLQFSRDRRAGYPSHRRKRYAGPCFYP